MWWMIVAQRRARAIARERKKALPPASAPWTEQMRSADGLSYGRSLDAFDDALPPPSDSGAIDGIKAIEGRR